MNLFTRLRLPVIASTVRPPANAPPCIARPGAPNVRALTPVAIAPAAPPCELNGCVIAFIGLAASVYWDSPPL